MKKGETYLPADFEAVFRKYRGERKSLREHYGCCEKTIRLYLTKFKANLQALGKIIKNSKGQDGFFFSEIVDFKTGAPNDYTNDYIDDRRIPTKDLINVTDDSVSTPSKADIQAALQVLSRSNLNVVVEQPLKSGEIDIGPIPKGQVLKIGVVSDTHLCSTKQQLTHLRSFYKCCQDEGIQHVLHAGDLLDGEHVYGNEHTYEIFRHGADAQLEYAVENYPMIPGIKTYVIAGNHDMSFHKTAGYNVIKALCKERDDLEYVGVYNGTVKFGGLKIMLHHGDKGGSYALSYKLQKSLEQLVSEIKPHIFILGHYHTVNILPMYRNIFGFTAGCFQSQTPFLLRKAIWPAIIGSIITIVFNDDSGKVDIQDIDYRWKPYYVPTEKDY